MNRWMFLNDGFVRADEARVPAMDAGLLHGAGLFETLRAHQGAVFRLDRHLARMKRSAEALDLALPQRFEGIPRLIGELLERNRLQDARLRLTVTPGDATQPDPPLLMISAVPFEPYPKEYYRKGMTVLISSRRQTPHDVSCAHKTLSYYNRLLVLREAANKTCQEAVWFTPDGALAEGCISNVFLVRDSVLYTPPLDTPVLPGITREAVIELAHRDREVREERLTIDDLLDSREAFLTNVIMKVMPVCRIERKEIGNGTPGPVTLELSQAYDEMVARECGNEK